MKFIDALGNVKFGKAMFFGNNIQMSEQQDGVVTINAAVLSGTGSKLSLLGDVNVTSIQDDQFLRWNAGTSFWINQFITAADIGAGTFKAGAYIFPNTVNITGAETVGGNLIVSGTTLLAGTQNVVGNQTLASNLTVSGTTILVGGIEAGNSTTFVHPALILTNYDDLNHFSSGTSETSIYSTTIKANTMATTGQVLRIRGIFRSQGSTGEWNIKLGGNVIGSGTLGTNLMAPFEITVWRMDAGSHRSFMHTYSGAQWSASIASTSSAATDYVWFPLVSQLITWSVDNLLDFRVRNYVTSSNSLNLEFFQIITESS